MAVRMSIREMRKKIAELAAGGGSGGAPEAMWKPPYGSLKAAVSDPVLTTSRTGLLASQLYLSRVYVPEPIDMSRLHWITTAAASGLTLAEVAVFNPDLELLGRTGDVKAKFMGLAGPNSELLTPVRSLHVGGEGEWVFVAHHQVGGTARASMAGHALAISSLALLDGSPPRCTSIGSVNAIPDEIDPLSVQIGATNMVWYGIS